MNPGKDKEPAILDVQRQRLSFLIRKSRKLETRLAELQSEDHSMELRDVHLVEDAGDNELREIKQLIDSVNKLKAEYYCLSYQTNVYNGAIPPGLIDYMPDQPVESTLAVPGSFDQFNDHNNQIYSDSIRASHSPLASPSGDTTPNTPTPTGDAPSTSETFALHQINKPSNWSCPKCSFDNHPLIDVCEICEHRRHNFTGTEVQSDKKCKSSSRGSRCENSICYCHLAPKP